LNECKEGRGGRPYLFVPSAESGSKKPTRTLRYKPHTSLNATLPFVTAPR
jgi:hypothetical protein